MLSLLLNMGLTGASLLPGKKKMLFVLPQFFWTTNQKVLEFFTSALFLGW